MPGLTVKDKAGSRKTVTRVQEGRVYWTYADRAERRQHVTEYERFIDTHFMIAQNSMLKMPEAA